MRVLVAGATGVIGRHLVPLLTSVGHDVVGLARSTERADAVEGAGGRIVVADALDRSALTTAVRDAAPDAIVNVLTAIPADLNPKRIAQEFSLTNRLRTEGTRNLLAAADAAGTRRVIAEGLAYAYDPGEDEPAHEDSPFWRNPPTGFGPVLDALREMESAMAAASGLVLRLGHLYGPGTSFGANGPVIERIRAGKFPIVGGGTATFSFTHAHDAASAIVAALDKDVTGALNIVDDDPAPVREWLPALAGMVRAPAPKRAPAFLARIAVGGWGVAYMTRLRGADNTRAKLNLDWRPRYGSWRDGFADELTGSVSAP